MDERINKTRGKIVFCPLEKWRSIGGNSVQLCEHRCPNSRIKKCKTYAKAIAELDLEPSYKK